MTFYQNNSLRIGFDHVLNGRADTRQATGLSGFDCSRSGFKPDCIQLDFGCNCAHLRDLPDLTQRKPTHAGSRAQFILQSHLQRKRLCACIEVDWLRRFRQCADDDLPLAHRGVIKKHDRFARRCYAGPAQNTSVRGADGHNGRAVIARDNRAG